MLCSPSAQYFSHLLSRSLKPGFIALATILLCACGTPGPGGDSPTQVDSELNCEGTEIDLVVRATSAMRDQRTGFKLDWQRHLYKALTPSPAYALQGLGEINSLSTSDISVVTLDHTGRESSYRDIAYEVKKASSSGYRLEFCDADGGFQPRANIVVKAKLNQTVSLYAPLHLTQGSVPIFVDANSHYVITQLIAKLNTAEQLEALLQSQSAEKARLLRTLYISTDAFDLQFEADDTLAQALSRLRADPAYSVMVDAGLSELLKNPPEPIAKGNLQGDNPSIGFETCFTDTRRYHSSYFRIGAIDVLPQDGTKQLGFSTDISSRVPAGVLGNADILYPSLSRTSFLYTPFQLETLSPQLPFNSSWLSFSSNRFNLDKSDYFSFFSAVPGSNNNQISSLLTDTLMSKESNVLFDRSIPAYIPLDLTNTGASRSSIGWSQNPVYTRLYQSSTALPSLNNQGECETRLDQSPTWLSAAYFGTAARYNQGSNTGNSFVRDNQQDKRELFTWEVHGRTTEQTFDKRDLEGKIYGVISYALKLDANAPQVSLSADLWQWEAANIMRQSQPSSHYESFLLERNTSTSTQFSRPAPSSQNRSYFTIAERTSQGSQNTGLIGLDGGQQAPFGHSSQNGKYLAFTQDTDEQGRGLILAAELRQNAPSFATIAQGGTVYTLQGNALEMANEGNLLRNITGSTLTFYPPSAGSGDSCNARIALKQTHVSAFTFGTEPVPVKLEPALSALSSNCQINRGEISLQFDSLLENNEQVVLKGFMSDSALADSQPGNLINFIWVEDNGLGLVFAQKLQDLNTQRR